MNLAAGLLSYHMHYFSFAQRTSKTQTRRSAQAYYGITLVCLGLLSGCGQAQEISQSQDAGDEQLAVSTEPVLHGPGVGQWRRFLGENCDSHSPETGIEPELWDPAPSINWTTLIGESYGAPSVADGRVYQFDRTGGAERLTCYRASDGRELWSWSHPAPYRDAYGYNNGPRCSPVLEDDRIYLLGVSGILSCVDANTHKTRWQIVTSREYGVITNFFGVAANPIIHDNLLIVMVGGSPEESQRYSTGTLDRVQPNRTAIVAFDKMTGQEVYRVGNDLASYSSPCIHRIHDRAVGFAFLRSGLLGWDAATGEELFTYPWRASFRESVNAAVPVVRGNQVLLSEAYEIGSVLLEISDSFEPQVVWQDNARRRDDNNFRAHWSTPVLAGGYLYGGSGRNPNDSDFRCIDWQTGEVQWMHWFRAREHPDERNERVSVLAIDDYLIALGEYGTLRLVRPNPEQFEVVKSVRLDGLRADDGRPLLQSPCWAAPVVAEGRLYLRGRERLVCMQLIPEQTPTQK